MSEPAKPAAGLEGVVATETEISFLDTDHEEIVIRGYDLIELAESSTYLEVAHLLLEGALPSAAERTAFTQGLQEESTLPEPLYQLFALFEPKMPPMDCLRTALSLLAGYDPDPAEQTPETNRRKGRRILARLPALVAHGYRIQHGLAVVQPDPALSYSENFLTMLTGKRPKPLEAELFDTTLVCYIEHELPNSTFAARVIASTMSDIYGALVGAAASLKGPLHGGANEAAAQMLLALADPATAKQAIQKRLARKERIMGFGHRVYMRRPDPRAVLLERFLPDLVKGDPEAEKLYEVYRIVKRTMFEEKGLHPNLDYPVGLIFHLLGIPVALFTPIFFVARTAGLCAHVIEQHAHNRLYRPRVAYTGPRALHPDSPDSEAAH